jgi:hypothetical protein
LARAKSLFSSSTYSSKTLIAKAPSNPLSTSSSPIPSAAAAARIAFVPTSDKPNSTDSVAPSAAIEVTTNYLSKALKPIIVPVGTTG